MTILSDNLKYLRQQKGITQKKLSELTGIPTANINAYEGGRCEPPIKSFLILSQFYELIPHDLYFTHIQNVDFLQFVNENNL